MDNQKEFERQLAIITQSVSEIAPLEEFKEKLKKSISTGKPLRVKYGIDPTRPDIHVGHLVPCRKMRQFQDLGHQAVVIIGDYTAQIGDPSGKDQTRPPLTKEQVAENAQTYMEQIYSVLDPKRTEVRYQSSWFGDVNLMDVLKWAHETTVAKLFSHDTFKKRINDGSSLGLHEFFYPVLQGVDSVYVEADVELGGTDQKFNVLMGRDYQKNREMEPQVAILLPIILGTCGTQKMSKSLDNYIPVIGDPFDQFGRVMSIPDHLMPDYYRYVAWASDEEIHEIEEGLKSNKLHPNEIKKELARRVVSTFHGEEVGSKMKTQFEAVFAKGKIPDDTDTYSFKEGENIIDILINSALFSSKGEVRRLMTQGGLSVVDGEKIKDANLNLDKSFDGKVLKAGKRKFLKLKQK